MDELRWFLLILGIVVVAAIYGYGRLQEWRQEGPPWRRRRDGREPFADEPLADDDIEGALNELDHLLSEQRTEIRQAPAATEARDDRAPPAAEEPHIAEAPAGGAGSGPEPEPVVAAEPEPTGAPAAAAHPEPAAEPFRASWRERLHRLRPGTGSPATETMHDSPSPLAGEEKIVVINIAAPEHSRFAGPELVAALEAAGMRHGEHGIFHRVLETRDGVVSLYSAANILKPGWFDLNTIETFRTPGVAFFLRLPGPFDGLAAFEQMLGTARESAERLGGHLLDARRCDLTQQAIEHIREDLLEYRRRAHLAARQAR